MIQTRIILHGSDEHKEMVELRRRILRLPLGLGFDDEEIAGEKDDIHVGVFDGEKLIACALVRLDGLSAHIRQVAVSENIQGQGLGKKVMAAAEEAAAKTGSEIFKLHARDSARKFYETIGYTTEGEPFEKLTIKHWLMYKPVRG